TNESLSNPVIELFEIAKIYLPAGKGATGKGDSHLLCQAPEGPSRQKVAVTFSDLPEAELPQEWWMLALTGGRPYPEVKGVVEAIIAATCTKHGKQVEDISYENADLSFLDPKASCRLVLDGKLLGYVGQLSPQGLKQADLRMAASV